MNNRSVTLLALLAANDHLQQPEVHRTTLMKLAFLTDTIRPLYRIWCQIFPFVRYNYGPYSEDVFYQLDTLIFNGLVQVTTMQCRGGRTEARYKITAAGHAALSRIDAEEIIDLTHDLVWALQSLGIEQATTITKLVYQEAEFARIFADHINSGIGPEEKMPLPSVTAANNETLSILMILRELVQLPNGDEFGFEINFTPREVVRIFLRSLAMQVPHRH